MESFVRDGYGRTALFRWAAVLAVFLSVAAGCRSARELTYHVNQEFDFSQIKRIGVLPFDNLSNDKTAGEAVRQTVINEMLILGIVDVAMPGDVLSAMEKAKVRSVTTLDAEQLKALGKMLKVDALIFGTVTRFGEMRSGNVSAPEVTVTIMMADAPTGSVLWSVTNSSIGDSFMSRHFGARSESMSETMIRVVREAVKTLVQI